MKVTNPPRETVSSLNYRDAEETPTTTAPELTLLSAAALRLLARDAVAEGSNSDKSWNLSATQSDGLEMTIRCSGPDLPDGVPADTAHPSIIPTDRPWVGTYRLTVGAPLVVLDLYWRADAPLRILGFSRGDWEAELVSLAAG